MTTEKYSPNWLLKKIESSKTDAQKLLQIIEFQNQLIKELKQGQSLPIDSVVGNNTWGAKFQKIISRTSEARLHLLGSWWNINDFEIDCGLFRIDVVGVLETHHMSDCERIEMDGVEYTLEDVYE